MIIHNCPQLALESTLDSHQVAHYYPITDTISAILQNPLILNIIDSYRKAHEKAQEEPEISDILTAELATAKRAVHYDEGSFNLMIYYDEVTIANPLGTAAQKHKIGAFYFTLCEFPPEIRSHLDFIYLLAVGNAETLKSKGIEIVLRPLVNEIRELSSGRVFQTSSGSRKIRILPFLLLGDTPALNHLIGFKEAVGASFRKCRTCFASKDDISKTLELSLFQKHTVEQYRISAAQVEMDLNAGEFRSSIDTGITRLSSIFEWTRLNDFNPFIQSPDDLMHVLLEGIIPYTFKMFFSSLWNKRIFNRAEAVKYQNEIRFFPYHNLDKPNAPIHINLFGFWEDRMSTHLNAANYWTFLRCLPHYSFASILNVNPEWEIISILLKMTANLLARTFCLKDIFQCKSNAQFFLIRFSELFPHASFIPKFHYLLHIIESIKTLGPPCTYWSMRFEAKHKQIKNFNKFSNYKNLLGAISFHHSIQLAWLSQASEAQLFPSEVTGFRQDSSISCDVLDCNGAQMGSVMKINKSTNIYQIDSILLIRSKPQLVFGRIMKIYLCQKHNGIWFQIEIMRCEKIDEVSNSFLAKSMRESIIVKSSLLPHAEPMAFYKTPCETLISIPIKRKMSFLD